jgi:hypothetical protein
MNVDMSAEAQKKQNLDAETLKEVQPKNTKEAPRVNGMMMNQEAIVDLDESQTTVSDHPPEGTIEDGTSWLERYSKVQTTTAGTSIQPP